MQEQAGGKDILEVYNVGIAITNLPFWDALHHLFMFLFGGWFTIAIASLIGYRMKMLEVFGALEKIGGKPSKIRSFTFFY